MARAKTKVALITGASGGIGLELAKLFAQDGHSLVLVARSREKLEAIKQDLEAKFNVKVWLLVSDLSEPGGASEVYDEMQKLSLGVEYLVNNAGVGVYGAFEKTDWEEEKRMLQLNMVSLTELTKRFLPEMISGGSGKILNVASAAAFQPGPLMALYYASKAYVLHFSEAIAEELSGTGVTVTALCPGATATGFSDAAHAVKSRLFSANVMSVSDVCRAGYKAMKRGTRVIIPGLPTRMLANLPRISPRALMTKAVKWVNQET